jgi:flagellin-like protein
MKKGVSPVVATVLLIAIAVISSVAVWYWVAPLTSQQPTQTSLVYSFISSDVFKNASKDGCGNLTLTNTGGQTIPANIILEIRYAINGTHSGRWLNISVPLPPGQSILYSISIPFSNVTNQSSIVPGSYFLTGSVSSSSVNIEGLSDVRFNCV